LKAEAALQSCSSQTTRTRQAMTSLPYCLLDNDDQLANAYSMNIRVGRFY